MTTNVKRVSDDVRPNSPDAKIPRTEQQIDVTEQLNELRSDLTHVKSSIRALELQVTELKTGFESFTRDILSRFLQPNNENLARCQNLMGERKYEEALPLLLKEPVQNERISALLGMCYFQLNNFPKARQVFEQRGNKLSVAECYCFEGNFQEAKKLYAEAKRPGADPLSIWINGYCHYAEGKYEEAIQIFSEGSFVLTGFCLLKLGKFEEARSFFAKEKDAQTMSGLGDYYLYKNQPEKALEAYIESKRISVKPRSHCERGIGDCKLQTNQIEEARKFFEEALRINPYNSEATRGLGDCCFAENNIQQALVYYTRAKDLFPANIQANLGLAKCFLKERKFEEAKKCFEYLVKLTPENHWLKVQIGNYYNAHRRFEEARKWYEAAFVLDPCDIDTELSIGYCLYQEHDFLNAKRIFLKHPNNPRAKLGLGQSEMKQGNFASAKEIFLSLFKIFPEMIIVEYAECLQLEGKTDSAKEYLWKALVKQPNNSAAKIFLAEVLVIEKNYYEAKQLFTEVLHVELKSRVKYGLGVCFFYEDNIDEAEKCFQEAFKLNPKRPQSLFMLGECCLKKGKLVEAIEYYQRFLDKEPGSEIAKDRLKSLLAK